MRITVFCYIHIVRGYLMFYHRTYIHTYICKYTCTYIDFHHYFSNPSIDPLVLFPLSPPSHTFSLLLVLYFKLKHISSFPEGYFYHTWNWIITLRKVSLSFDDKNNEDHCTTTPWFMEMPLRFLILTTD